jgi:hypothetical protein
VPTPEIEVVGTPEALPQGAGDREIRYDQCS